MKSLWSPLLENRRILLLFIKPNLSLSFIVMRTPLKVMQLVLSLEIGGMEKLVYDMVKRIDKRIISPFVCCLDKPGYYGCHLYDLGEELQRNGYQVYTLPRKPGIDWGVIQQLRIMIRQKKVDIVHAQQYTPYCYGVMASLYNMLRLSRNSPKLIYTSHGIPYPYKRRMKRVVVNSVFSLFTQEIVTISEDTKSNIVKYENFPAHKIKVVYNGIDLSQFSKKVDRVAKKQSLELTPDYKVIGIVARLDPVKNHTLLLRAFKRVLHELPETYLLIVGDGPEKKRLESLAELFGISGQALFLGARNDVPELLHIFDVSVLSSFSEGMSVTLLEAMGAGIPIVATNVGGNPEVVKDQETGYLVPNNNDQEMAAALIKLLQDEEARRKMGKAGQQRAHTIFSVDRMVNTYTNLYLKVVGA